MGARKSGNNKETFRGKRGEFQNINHRADSYFAGNKNPRKHGKKGRETSTRKKCSLARCSGKSTRGLAYQTVPVGIGRTSKKKRARKNSFCEPDISSDEAV